MRVALVLLATPLFACAEDLDTRVNSALALTGDATHGASLFATHCAVCHAADGSGGTGPDLTAHFRGAEGVAEAIIAGRGEMTAFGDALSDQDVADLVAHLDAIAP